MKPKTMIADTNILVRYLTGLPAEQAEKTKILFNRAVSNYYRRNNLYFRIGI